MHVIFRMDSQGLQALFWDQHPIKRMGVWLTHDWHGDWCLSLKNGLEYYNFHGLSLCISWGVCFWSSLILPKPNPCFAYAQSLISKQEDCFEFCCKQGSAPMHSVGSGINNDTKDFCLPKTSATQFHCLDILVYYSEENVISNLTCIKKFPSKYIPLFLQNIVAVTFPLNYCSSSGSEETLGSWWFNQALSNII